MVLLHDAVWHQPHSLAAGARGYAISVGLSIFRMDGRQALPMDRF